MNNSSANIKFSKTQLSMMVQLGGFIIFLVQPAFTALQRGAPISVKNAIEYFLNKGMNELRKNCSQ